MGYFSNYFSIYSSNYFGLLSENETIVELSAVHGQGSIPNFALIIDITIACTVISGVGRILAFSIGKQIEFVDITAFVSSTNRITAEVSKVGGN